MKDKQIAEVSELLAAIRRTVPGSIDAKSAILQMKEEGSKHWRQMEWIGFWFEHFVETKLLGLSGFVPGPKYNRVSFDLQRDFIWDLKAHPDQAGPRVLLNDQIAISKAIESGRGLGYVVIGGDAKYDETGDFKQWHDELKGKKTAYVEKNEAKGAPSRRRKVTFIPLNIVVYWFSTPEAILRGLDEGWLLNFQKGMTNSNGRPRNSKFMLVTDKVPSEFIIAFETL